MERRRVQEEGLRVVNCFSRGRSFDGTLGIRNGKLREKHGLSSMLISKPCIQKYVFVITGATSYGNIRMHNLAYMREVYGGCAPIISEFPIDNPQGSR